MGGGKGSATPPPMQAPQVQGGGGDDMAAMLMMMEMLSAQPQSAEAPGYIPPPPPTPKMPEIQKPTPRNWAEEYEKARAKARADYQASKHDSYGRADTVHTSPLLDEEDPNFNSLVDLAGSK